MDGAGKTRKEIRLSLHNNLICPMAYWICGYGSLARIILQPYNLHSANHILESSNGFHLRHFIRGRQIQNKQCLFFYTTTQFSQYIRRLISHSTEEPRRSEVFLCIYYEDILQKYLLFPFKESDRYSSADDHECRHYCNRNPHRPHRQP